MSSPAFEAFLARLYVDAATRAEFLADPRGSAAAAGLTAEECEALARIDRAGLELVAESISRKRASHTPRRSRRWKLRWDRAR